MKLRTLLVLALTSCMVTGVAKADFAFGESVNLGPAVNSSTGDGSPCISADGLSLFFVSDRSGGSGGKDLWVTMRATQEDQWGEPLNLGSTVNSSANDRDPSISPDGLMLFFDSYRSGGYGGYDIYVTSRETIEDNWGTPVNLGKMVNTSAYDSNPNISTDGLSLFLQSNRSGGHGDGDIWVTTRTTKDADWITPVNLGPTVNSTHAEKQPSISVDGLVLFFSDYSSTSNPRPGGYGGVSDLWMTKRLTPEGDWGPPVNLGPTVNTPYVDHAPDISSDGRTLFFNSDRPGGIAASGDIWQASITAVVDFNGDGIVDSADMCIMIDNWGTDYSVCDIGPMPWGDGIVDVEDLRILAENLFEEIDDPTLIAHWALDEAEGGTALDSASGNVSFVMGNPLWRPTGGMIGGAVELDGVDDFVITGRKLNTAEGAFSALAWIKGGAPGQVMISQAVTDNLLMIDASGGKLMTEFNDSDGLAGPLASDAVITDDNWHRIGLVWDGLKRRLYVDSVVVAEDTQASLEGHDRGLYIGCDKNMQSGFFSGLIDDVRIYNRAVKP